MQILVVDDSRTMRMLVTRTLRQAGFGGHDIVEAGDGVEALEVIRSVGADIVLCDWNMPRMNGLELLQALRGAGDQRPFGFVTSEGTPTMREVAEKEGAHFVITKPFTAEVFQSVLGGVNAGASAEGEGEDERHGLPVSGDLSRILEALLGRPVGVRDPIGPVSTDAAAVVWSYQFPDGGLAAVGALDFKLATILGAGFGLLPQGRVNEVLAEARLPHDMVENLREVVNVLVGLYAPMSDEHIGLDSIWHRGGPELPADVADLLTCRTRRLDAAVSLGGYGEGSFSAIPAWRLVRSEVPA
jgi:two-component system chemotaxis response regulator CheY